MKPFYLACFGAAISLSTICSAQTITLDSRSPIFLDGRGDMRVGPTGSISLSDLIREQGGTLNFRDIENFLKGRTKEGYLTGTVYHNPRRKPGEDLTRSQNGLNGAEALPGIFVTLENVDTRAVFGPYETILPGVFVSQPVPVGDYVMCAEGFGWQRVCDEIQIVEGRTHRPAMNMNFISSRQTAAIRGHIELADGGFPNANILDANVLKGVRVTATDANGREITSTFANAMGNYVLPGLPAGSAVELDVRLEQAQVSVPVAAQSMTGGGVLRRDVVLPNSRPDVTHPVALWNGVEVTSAPPGETVEVIMDVRDRDGHPARIEWLLPPNAGNISSTSDPVIKWELPGAVGLHTLRAVISDDHGGYVQRALRLNVNKGELFTGVVSATNMAAVPNATVEVNGTATVTNSAGYFSVLVQPADRYVLNIRSLNHAFFSQVYDGASTGGRYELVRATVGVFDPTQDIVLTDQRTSEDCRGAPSANMNWEAVDRLRLQPIRLGLGEEGPKRERDKQMFDFVDLPSALSPQRKRRHECGPGATVRIPANALVDENGNPPPGQVRVAISTYDIEAEMEMPGDWSIAPEGTTDVIGAMESYGAAFVEVRDGTREYNLAPNQTADLTIPVAQAQLAIIAPLAPEIPIFHYDEERGVWNRTGGAQLQGTSYVTKVEHFSAINADVEKQDPACIHIQTDPSGVMPDQFLLEYTIPGENGAAARVRSGTIDASMTNDHVIYNLPENTDIVLVPYGPNPDDPTLDTPYGTYVVNSGTPHNQPTNPPPHTSCTNTAVISIPDTPKVVPQGVQFLAGLRTFFAYDVTNDPQGASLTAYKQDIMDASRDYYDQIDPLNRRTTFGDFKALWGFDALPQGQDYANARYANSADLGFGRDMHCTKKDIDGDNTVDVACFVSNYGERPDPDQDNANWASTQDSSKYLASVIMEWAPLETGGSAQAPTYGADNIVKFLVYGQGPNGDHDQGTFVFEADLDLYGARPIPQLCMVCHGGNLPNKATQDSDGNVLPFNRPLPVFDSAASVNLGSRFLPFDLESYTFPNVGGTFSGRQEAAFKDLNLNFVAPTDTSAAIDELLTEFYGATGAASAQNTGFVVNGWQTNPASEEMYEHVVGPNCRICHVAHDNVNGVNYQFNTSVTLPAAFATYVACNQRTMPHSVRTYERFWGSLNPHQPGALVNYAASQGASGADCTFPPNNGQTFEVPAP